MTRSNHTRSSRRLRVLALAGCSLWILAANQNSDGVEGTRELIRERMAAERMIWAEKSDWAVAKDVLESQVALRQREIDSLRAEVTAAQSEIGEADTKIEALRAEDEAAQAVTAALTTHIETVEAQTKALLARLPEFIRTKVQPLSQQFPEDPAATKLSVSVRYANLAAVLNEIVKANAEITLTSEVRELADGRSAEVAALYVGLSQAYFVTTTGDAAGIGTAGPEGWSWIQANDAAVSIELAIKVLKNEEPAAYVGLPVSVD